MPVPGVCEECSSEVFHKAWCWVRVRGRAIKAGVSPVLQQREDKLKVGVAEGGIKSHQFT